jgi:hypothetical protein
VPVGAEDEDLSSLLHECNKWLNSEIRLNIINDILLIFVYNMCVN